MSTVNQTLSCVQTKLVKYVDYYLTPLQIMVMMMMTTMMIISNFTQLMRISMESEALSGCIWHLCVTGLLFCDLELPLLSKQNYPLCCRCYKRHCCHILFNFSWSTRCCNYRFFRFRSRCVRCRFEKKLNSQCGEDVLTIVAGYKSGTH